MARRRVSRVIEQQYQLREQGRIRFGERKPTDAKRPGKPIEFPRISSRHEDVVREVAALYGGEPRPWEREDGHTEWDVLTEGPIAVCCAPGIDPYTTAYEQWANGFNTVRCDGETCEFRRNGRWVDHACVCAERGIEPEDRDCKKTTRIVVMIVGVRRLGLFRVDTKSHYASEELPAALALLQSSQRAGWMRMDRRERRLLEWDKKEGKDKPVVRKFPVIVVDAPFLPDEVMHLERGEDMAALPAPRPRTERPQLGPGIEPEGPRFDDVEPPPRDVEPVDLPNPDPVDADAADAAWEASGHIPGTAPPPAREPA